MEYFHLVEDPGQSKEEIRDLYAKYAPHFDDVMKNKKYDTPQLMAKAIMEVVKPNADTKIVDFAAGTGNLSQCLLNEGLDPQASIDAVDASPQMRKFAIEKKIYKEYYVSFIGGGEKLPFQKESYNLAMMSGAFLENHVPMDGLDAMLDAVKPGGYAVSSITDEWIATTRYEKLEDYISELGQRKGAEVEKRVFQSPYQGRLFIWFLRKKEA